MNQQRRSQDWFIGDMEVKIALTLVIEVIVGVAKQQFCQ